MQFHASNKRKLLKASAFDEDEFVDRDNVAAISNNLKVVDALDNTNKQKFYHLKAEGVDLAVKGEYKLALGVLYKASQLDQRDATIHEMKAQLYLELDMYMAALKSAQIAVNIEPDWIVGLQTLGRCQREIGEIVPSTESYKQALRLARAQPAGFNDIDELQRESDDVMSLCMLLEQKRKANLSALNEIAVSGTIAEEEISRCLYHLSSRARPVGSTSEALRDDIQTVNIVCKDNNGEHLHTSHQIESSLAAISIAAADHLHMSTGEHRGDLRG